MGNLKWTTESQRWLKDIYEYIEVDNPIAATNVVSGIYQRTQILSDHPEIGYRYQSSTRHIRILLYGHYRIALSTAEIVLAVAMQPGKSGT